MDENVYKILIVDDEKEILNTLSWVLSSTSEFKTEISTAIGSAAALPELDKQEFDLILSDYRMPMMNGIELLTMVKNDHPKTVRILITGYSDINLAKEAINKAEVHHYIEKPWDNDELRLTIHEALKRKDERETAEIKKVDKVHDALRLVEDFREEITAIPAEHISKQLIMLEFSSTSEFNKFSFALKNVKNANIADIQIFENRQIISIVIYPKRYAFIPKIE